MADITQIVYLAATSQAMAEEGARHPECHFATADAARGAAESYKNRKRLRVYKVTLRVHIERVVYHDRRKPPKEKP